MKTPVLRPPYWFFRGLLQGCTVAALIMTHFGSARAALLDGSFTPGSGANNPINAIARQSDGRIVVAGTFTGFDGTSRNRIARLNPEGSLDSSFGPASGADDNINAVAIQPDAGILIAGFFTAFDGVGRNPVWSMGSHKIIGPKCGTTLNNFIGVPSFRAPKLSVEIGLQTAGGGATSAR